MRSLETAATSFGVWCVWAACAAGCACNYNNPGFKVKGADEGGNSGTATSLGGTTSGTSVSSTPPTTTTEEPPTSTSTLGTAESSSGAVMTETGDTETSVTTGGPMPHGCNNPETKALTVAADTFLVDRSWEDGTGACVLIEDLDNEYPWPDDVAVCRDRNFGLLPALPLVDRPNEGGRDAIHYLVKFKVGALLDVNTQQPVEFSQIVSAELVLTVERLGEATTVGAFALAIDQTWEEGNKSGEQADSKEPTYRCRVAPWGKDPEKPCTGAWTFLVPIPEGGSPMREANTDELVEGEISPLAINFEWTDFEGGLETFFTAAGHQGFFIDLPVFNDDSTGDRLKVYAREAAEKDPVFKVTYCPTI